MADKKKMRVLLNGINQDIFLTIIEKAERTPYENYEALVKAIRKRAATKRVQQLLKALKPGTDESFRMTRTRSQRPGPPRNRCR